VLELAERVYFRLCLSLGKLLRSATYSKTRIVHHDGNLQVQKCRVFYAPLLVWLGGPLVRMLDTGVRVLPQQDWESRERGLYRTLHGSSIQINADRSLVLPFLAGKTLAELLEDPEIDEAARKRAIELAVGALVEFHQFGFTHGDAMAENVMVDLDAGVAKWLDFETIHEPSRPIVWRRADDVRALIATCLLRTEPQYVARTLELILDDYADAAVDSLVTKSFTSVWRRSLTFHLGQAPLSFQRSREVARLLDEHRRASYTDSRAAARG